MELKVVCPCGQKIKFDVEPVGGRMPFTLICPVCNADGTATANALLAQSAPPPVAPAFAPPPPPPAPPVAAGLKLNRTAEGAPELISPLAPSAPAIAPPPIGAGRPAPAGGFNLGLGILGAFLGAAAGAGLLLAFNAFAGFRFPLTGIIVGLLSGWLARLLGKGGDTKLGFIAGAFAALGTTATLYGIYGEIPPITIISIIISISSGYRIAAR